MAIKSKTYVVVYQKDTDDDIIATTLNKNEIIDLVQYFGAQEELLIVDGAIVKNFGNKIDLTRL